MRKVEIPTNNGKRYATILNACVFIGFVQDQIVISLFVPKNLWQKRLYATIARLTFGEISFILIIATESKSLMTFYTVS